MFEKQGNARATEVITGLTHLMGEVFTEHQGRVVKLALAAKVKTPLQVRHGFQRVQAVAVLAVNRGDQRALQVGAPDLITAGWPNGSLCDQSAAMEVPDGDACGADGEVVQRFTEPQLLQDPYTGAAEHEPRAAGERLGRLFANRDPQALLLQGQCRSQSADAGADDDDIERQTGPDGSGWRHRRR